MLHTDQWKQFALVCLIEVCLYRKITKYPMNMTDRNTVEDALAVKHIILHATYCLSLCLLKLLF